MVIAISSCLRFISILLICLFRAIEQVAASSSSDNSRDGGQHLLRGFDAASQQLSTPEPLKEDENGATATLSATSSSTRCDDPNYTGQDCSKESNTWTYEAQIELLTFDLDLFGENDDEYVTPEQIQNRFKLKSMTEKYLYDAFKKHNTTSSTIHRVELRFDNDNNEDNDNTSRGGENGSNSNNYENLSSSHGAFHGIAYFRGFDDLPTPQQVEDLQISALEDYDSINNAFGDYMENKYV